MNKVESTQKELVIPCEVYSRVVGYYRPVQNWNHGKRQEFLERNTYDSVFDVCKAVQQVS